MIISSSFRQFILYIFFVQPVYGMFTDTLEDIQERKLQHQKNTIIALMELQLIRRDVMFLENKLQKIENSSIQRKETLQKVSNDLEKHFNFTNHALDRIETSSVLENMIRKIEQRDAQEKAQIQEKQKRQRYKAQWAETLANLNPAKSSSKKSINFNETELVQEKKPTNPTKRRLTKQERKTQKHDITKHLQVDAIPKNDIAFLDTPGHSMTSEICTTNESCSQSGNDEQLASIKKEKIQPRRELQVYLQKQEKAIKKKALEEAIKLELKKIKTTRSSWPCFCTVS